MTGLTKAEEKKILSAADKITAGVELMVETPLHFIKCILMKHEKAALEVMKELHERAEKTEAKLAEAKRERDKHFAASKAQNEDITSLQAELAACRVDAGRYRWLRDMNNDDAAMRCVQLCGAAMDEAIDEAIKVSLK